MNEQKYELLIEIIKEKMDTYGLSKIQRQMIDVQLKSPVANDDDRKEMISIFQTFGIKEKIPDYDKKEMPVYIALQQEVKLLEETYENSTHLKRMFSLKSNRILSAKDFGTYVLNKAVLQFKNEEFVFLKEDTE
tara:strand:- start:205 stop:606 length:402 start_codon:yes stop_codon:yes gene_type:complete